LSGVNCELECVYGREQDQADCCQRRRLHREDAKELDALFRKVTGEEPKMWGPTIVGYGQYHYKYDSGHEGDICRVGFSPRKARHSLYLLNCSLDGEQTEFAALRGQLGKIGNGKGGYWEDRGYQWYAGI
jgi:hypothetical protein